MLLTHNLLLYENRQLATASYRKRRDLNLATPLNISGPSKRGSDALPIKTQLKTQTCTTRLLPWSRFGARQEKGNPENLDLTRSTVFFVVNTMRVKHVTTKSVIQRTPKGLQSHVRHVRDGQQVRVEAVVDAFQYQKSKIYSGYYQGLRL
jgi:hypothetical protein